MTMDIEEAKIYAAEQVMNALVSGNNFKGLGSLARGIIRDIAQSADENAKAVVAGGTDRTAERFAAMEKNVTEWFVKNMLGFNTKMDRNNFTMRQYTLREASDELVDGVWMTYMAWARAYQQISAAMPPQLSNAHEA